MPAASARMGIFLGLRAVMMQIISSLYYSGADDIHQADCDQKQILAKSYNQELYSKWAQLFALLSFTAFMGGLAQGVLVSLTAFWGNVKLYKTKDMQANRGK